MKTWTELTPDEQQIVREKERVAYVNAVCEAGASIFWDDDHPAAIRYKQLIAENEWTQTPWFLGESLYHDKVFRAFLDEQVENWLTDDGVYFLESGEAAIRIPHIKEQNQ